MKLSTENVLSICGLLLAGATIAGRFSVLEARTEDMRQYQQVMINELKELNARMARVEERLGYNGRGK